MRVPVTALLATTFLLSSAEGQQDSSRARDSVAHLPDITVTSTRSKTKLLDQPLALTRLVAATLRKKLGKEMAPYKILGACNPQLAHRVIELEPQIGALLPCNVVVRVAGGKTLVEIMDPDAVMKMVDTPGVAAVAKEVRTTTQVGANSVSMAAAAVKLAARIFPSIGEQNVLFIGAGEMIELCATHFAAQGPARLTVANRTLERATSLAHRFNGRGIELRELPDQLHEYDIVVSCTASSLPILGKGLAERALKARRHRPMFMVDLAVPRDIEAGNKIASCSPRRPLRSSQAPSFTRQLAWPAVLPREMLTCAFQARKPTLPTGPLPLPSV